MPRRPLVMRDLGSSNRPIAWVATNGPALAGAGTVVPPRTCGKPSCQLTRSNKPSAAGVREPACRISVSALPVNGYAAFTCAGNPARKLSDWRDFRSCPAQSDGTHAVSFRDGTGGSDDADCGQTEVGGQPVILIDDNARMAGIRIETDPHARLYLHKPSCSPCRPAPASVRTDGPVTR